MIAFETFSLWFVLVFVNVAYGWFETCNQNISLGATQISTITPPNPFPPRSSCKYNIVSPVGSTIRVDCTVDIAQPLPNCLSQAFFLSRDGDKDLRGSEVVCGVRRTVSRVSIGNEVTLGYTATSDATGNRFITCTVRTVATTQTNCDCGWNVNVSVEFTLELKS